MKQPVIRKQDKYQRDIQHPQQNALSIIYIILSQSDKGLKDRTDMNMPNYAHRQTSTYLQEITELTLTDNF